MALMTQLNASANIIVTNAITVTLTQSHVTPLKEVIWYSSDHVTTESVEHARFVPSRVAWIQTI